MTHELRQPIQAASPDFPPGSRPLSVVVPCRNERETIAACLDSILSTEYPRLEVIVVDGMSEDGTRGILTDYAHRFPEITIIDNPRRTQQTALNIGVRAAKGDFVMRMDAHATIEPGHLRECVRYLESAQADCVGGRIVTVPKAPTVVGRAIAAAMSEPFGVGGSQFRSGTFSGDQEPQWTTTVPYACYRRSVFETVGLFNEDLAYTEDLEFHRRMKDEGCRTLFVPSIVSQYFSRSDLRSFWKHSVNNGRWTILPTLYTGRLIVGVKHLIPLAFVASLIALIALAFVYRVFGFLLALEVGVYFVASIVVSSKVALRRRDLRLALLLPVVFATLHVGYGAGSLGALRRLCLSRVGRHHRA